MVIQLSVSDCKEIVAEMDVVYFSGSKGERLERRYPVDLPYLTGSLSYTGNHECCIFHSAMTARQPLRIASSPESPVLSFCFSLQGDFVFRYDTMSHEECWKEGTANFSTSGMVGGYMQIPEQTPMRVVEVLIAPSMVERLHRYYPEELGGLLRLMESNEFHQTFPVARPYPFSALQIVRELQSAEQMGNMEGVYRDSKVLELLSHFLVPQTADPYPAVNLKPVDVDALHDAKAILLMRYLDPPSLPELAKLAGINECKLKQGFRKCFDNTVYGILHQYRLDMACRYLLDSSKSVQEVASLCGYTQVSHFSAVFKKSLGVSPLSYRRRRTDLCERPGS